MNSHRTPRRQQGAALLALVAVLLLVLGIGMGWMSQAQQSEHRSLQARQHSLVAAAAAESGLAWFEAQINQGRIDAHCLPSPTGQRLRDALLQTHAAGTTAGPAAANGTVFARCMAQGAYWRCRCGLDGEAPPPPEPDPQHASAVSGAFLLKLGASPRPGVLRVRVRGCAKAGDCEVSDTPSPRHAMADLEATLAHLDVLQHIPQAAVTVRGDAQLVGAVLQRSSPTADAVPPRAQLSGRLMDEREAPHPLCAAPGACLQGDARLQSDALGLHLFGMDRQDAVRQPGMQRLSCPADEDCGPLIQAAYRAGATLIQLTGPVSVRTALDLGSPQRPVLLILDGSAELLAAMRLDGVIYVAGTLNWTPVPGEAPSHVHGALLADAHARLSGDITLQHDPNVLLTLKQSQGAWLRLPGAWTQWQ